MSKITTYKCDKCGKESNEPNLTTIGVGIKSASLNYSNFTEMYFNLYDPLNREMDICSDCLSNLGFVKKQKTDPEKVEQPYPSLEDMIREIIREEIDGKDGIRL